jgi:hypothetical protein
VKHHGEILKTVFEVKTRRNSEKPRKKERRKRVCRVYILLVWVVWKAQIGCLTLLTAQAQN